MQKLKERDLRKICTCCICKKGVLHTEIPLFWHVKVSRYVVSMKAINRQAGMEMFMGGNVALAQVFSADEDMAERIGDEATISFCEDCMLKVNHGLMSAVENECDRKAKETENAGD